MELCGFLTIKQIRSMSFQSRDSLITLLTERGIYYVDSHTMRVVREVQREWEQNEIFSLRDFQLPTQIEGNFYVIFSDIKWSIFVFDMNTFEKLTSHPVSTEKNQA